MILFERRSWLPPIIIAILTFPTFFPRLWNEFVYRDDDANFLYNAHYRGLAWANIRWMFTTFHHGETRNDSGMG